MCFLKISLTTLHVKIKPLINPVVYLKEMANQI